MTRLPGTLQEIRFRIYPVLFGWYESEQGEGSLKCLAELVERAAQSAPDARITITSTNKDPLSLKCQLTADAIIGLLQRQRRDRKRLSSNPLAQESEQRQDS